MPSVKPTHRFQSNRRRFLQGATLAPAAALWTPGPLGAITETPYNGPIMKLALGNDDHGFPAKDYVLKVLRGWGHTVKDCGCFSTEPSDFPDIAKLVGEEILSGRAERGVMICGTGQGASMAGNKIHGIRAALCHDLLCAHQCVEDDNANMVCFGAEIIGHAMMREVLRNFLTAKFSTEEVYRRRVRKLDAMDAR